MGKISKRQMQKHQEALKILEKNVLSHDEKEFVFENYHEGATNMNNLVSAHFTPESIALSMAHCIRTKDFIVDLCAGIGMLSYKAFRFYQCGSIDSEPRLTGICVENCTEYYNIGRKLLPEFHWINGDIFDDNIISEIQELTKDKTFSIISNPPFGRQVKSTSDKLKYTSAEFEYKIIELGAILGAYDGVFLIPQQSCPFRITGSRGNTFSEEYKTSAYNKFVKQTGLEINANQGFTTEITESEDGWKDVSITTEIAIMEYDEYEYIPKYPIVKEVESNKQLKIFDLGNEDW